MLKSELVRTTTKTTIAMKTMKTLLTPEEDPMPEDPNPPWDPKVSRPWSLLPSPQRARAPFRESIEGVGDVISPDFCLTWDIMSSDLILCIFYFWFLKSYHAAPGWPLEGGWPKVPNTGLTTYLERGLFTPRELRFLPTPTEQRKKGKGQELLCV